MSNTFTMYDTVTTFQRRQREAYDAYIEAMKGLETAKGSQYYSDRQREAMDKRKAAEEQARSDARYWIKKTAESMIEANKARKAVPPTAEQLAILQTMKLRTDISDAELDQIANAMDGNAMALGVVNDFAKEVYQRRNNSANTGSRHPYRITKNYLAMVKGDYPIAEMEKEIAHIARACGSIVDSDGANRVRGRVMELHSAKYGGNADRDTLAREKIASSEQEFYEGITSVPVETLQKCLNG